MDKYDDKSKGRIWGDSCYISGRLWLEKSTEAINADFSVNVSSNRSICVAGELYNYDDK